MASGTTAFSNNNADVWLRDVMSDCVLCPRACHVNRLATASTSVSIGFV